MTKKFVSRKREGNIQQSTRQFAPRPFAIPQRQPVAPAENSTAQNIQRSPENSDRLSRIDITQPEPFTPRLKVQRAEQAEVAQENPGIEGETIQRSSTSKNYLENLSILPPEPPSTPGFPIQAKLTVGAVGDPYEQEADRVARQVVSRIQAPQVNFKSSESNPVQRKISIQAFGGEGGEVSSEWEGQLNQVRGGGQPLSPSLREPMEREFGADFSGVRLHTGAQADNLARSIQAKAFTTGQDVFFGQGAYQPGSRGGQELIAHELTHVVQQKKDVKERESIQRDLDVNQIIDKTEIISVEILKKNTIFRLQSTSNKTLVIKIEILPYSHGNAGAWSMYKGRYETTQELAMGILADTEAPKKLVLQNVDLQQLQEFGESPNPVPTSGIANLPAQNDLEAKNQLLKAIQNHRDKNGLMVKMEDVGAIIDVQGELYEKGEKANKGVIERGQEGVDIKNLFSEENVVKLGKIAYYDILTRNYDRFDFEAGPVNNINIKKSSQGVIGLDNIDSGPSSFLAGEEKKWKLQLEEMKNFQNSSQVMNYAYLCLEKFHKGYQPEVEVKAFELDPITLATRAAAFEEGFESARKKASEIVKTWEDALAGWLGASGTTARTDDAIMKAKQVIYARQMIGENKDANINQRSWVTGTKKNIPQKRTFGSRSVP